MPDADQAELRAQLEGRWAIAAGIVIALGAAALAVAYRAATGVGFPPEITLLVYAGSSVAVVTGLRERFGRPLRRTVQQILDNQAEILELAAGAPEVRAELSAITEAVAKLPGYPEGFLDGAEVTRKLGSEPG